MEMDPLKHYQEITKLGDKIIRELYGDARFSLTRNWISQYVAELMFKVEQEKDEEKCTELKRECFSTILKLWEYRENFPGSARPLGKLRETMAILQAMIKDDENLFLGHRYQSDNADWGKFMHTVAESIEDILKISLLSSVSDEYFKREKEWLDHEKFLTEEERKIIEYLDFLLSKTESGISITYVRDNDSRNEAKSESKLEKLLDRLQFLIEKQQGALNEIRKKLLSGGS